MEQDQELLPPPVPPRITVQIQVAGRLSRRTAVFHRLGVWAPFQCKTSSDPHARPPLHGLL